MDRLQYIRPNLIEPGVKYFLNSTLEQCNTIKYKYYAVALCCSFLSADSWVARPGSRDVRKGIAMSSVV